MNLNGSVSRIASTTPACTFGISPTSQSFSAAGGTGSVGVTTQTGCPWTASENATWIHITSGASGNGNGSVGYTVDANTSSSPRTGTMTVAGQVFTVNQSGAATCTFSISPTTASYTRTGGTGTVAVTVTAGTGCNWTAVSNASWITITGGASGSGNGTVSYSVGPYGGPPKKRTGTATIAGQTFTVNQTK